MSFADAVLRFNKQAALHRHALNPTTVQRMLSNAPSGLQLSVTLSPIRAEREITESGFVIIHRAQLRVSKKLAWQPVEGDEFTKVETGELFRCNTAVGGDDLTSAEIVCDVIRISP